MQLTQLEIKGFKSFGDKITINFNDGVTAIVGPNGCGKSNVVDAIRWVLGEQSTRMLRSEKMENIIFNGTKTRKPSNLAEVSLTFDNTKNILPTDFTKVTITRKLYRSGESEYRLNDVQCRLKDITDLFLDTGIGSDSYSIIELKMIDEIIANKDNSRRALFEEASGISKYKLRKKQTFNKLKDTEADLSRVEDLLFEIEKNLKTLENQAKKAERYYRLKEQYKTLSLSLASYRIIGFRESLTKLEDKEQLHSLESSGINTEISNLEAFLQKLKLENLNLEKNLSIQQKATNEFIAKIRTYESDKKLKNEQLRFLEDKKTRLSDELEKDQNQLNHVFYNQKRLNEEHLQESEILEKLRISTENQHQGIIELRLEQQKSKAALDTISLENNELQNQVYKLEKEIAILNIQKEALYQESSRNMADTESKETELNEFNKVITELKGKLESKQKEYIQNKELEDELERQIRRSTEHLKEQKEILNQESRKLDSKQNEYNLTKSMVDNLEGFPESIRFLKKNAGWTKQAPLFSDILFCREEYRIAIENYLEPVMNHYVVETQAEAVQAIQLLSDSSRGRANFFILDALNVAGQRPSVNTERKDLIPALEIIDTDAKYRPLCEMLLYNVYLLQSGEENELRSALPSEQVVILSKTGMFTKTRTGMSGGSVGLFEGKRIGRAKNLEKLSKEINSGETLIVKLKNSIAEEEIKLKDLIDSSQKDLLQESQLEINRLSNEYTSVKTKQEQYLAFIENSLNRKQDIEQKIASIGNELLASEPLLIELKVSKQIKQEQVLNDQQSYNELAESLNSKSALYNQENIRFHQQQNKVSGIEKDLEYRESQQKNLETRIGLNQAELEKTQAGIKETLQHADHSDEDLIAMYVQKEEFEAAVNEAEQSYYASRVQITEMEEKISLLRRNKEQAELISNELKDQKTAIKLELNALKERLSVEFDVDISVLLDEESYEQQTDSEQNIREKTERIKRQLDEFGAINPMAMEAYQEMNERYNFIQSQKKDLAEAKSSLLQTIKEIDDTAKEKFMAAFSDVRTHFIQVFRSLFNEEDSCDLVLADPSNPLESDIDIIARPKGKRPLSINQLSGGEKTLTATALLFSLYLLKPAPFCIFDEVDAPLDDTNIDKFNNIIREFSDQSQFIIVSHNKRTIASTDIIYGVTMAEQGVSRVVAVDIREVA
ncbi:MAG: chromosome segregation protein SMC [Sphingobacteriales bacterium 17-39-43]|uniref:chromosome segregation protein SMC n=1 Tax=Daejeonella sp. TaxID=2805397 RepID=UPI000BC6E6E5|nr:chromosome segregation protein SMC [Daejeonella sp.]OYZ33042.1 MAG: chromosome segregation protein SMC [Sphingobacteriales bacterium 16-39-50]OZA26451.1 MAG: chromosome segregation protein SMC [Sphingobacteriales bacterium 17-39-43]HQT21592.1 chromosome segregation protein SMC [Daejeonella sp.]HQT56323.1 chromosome segregation protein SMC [Daejeonella sp.]